VVGAVRSFAECYMVMVMAGSSGTQAAAGGPADAEMETDRLQASALPGGMGIEGASIGGLEQRSSWAVLECATVVGIVVVEGSTY